jgi:hypothetical protein
MKGERSVRTASGLAEAIQHLDQCVRLYVRLPGWRIGKPRQQESGFLDSRSP